MSSCSNPLDPGDGVNTVESRRLVVPFRLFRRVVSVKSMASNSSSSSSLMSSSKSCSHSLRIEVLHFVSAVSASSSCVLFFCSMGNLSLATSMGMGVSAPVGSSAMNSAAMECPNCTFLEGVIAGDNDSPGDGVEYADNGAISLGLLIVIE